MKEKDIERLIVFARKNKNPTITIPIEEAEKMMEYITLLKMFHDSPFVSDDYFEYCLMDEKEREIFRKCWNRFDEEEETEKHEKIK